MSSDDYCAIPFINADGYHSKTVAYSIWHIIRIEDIVVNSLIRREKEVLYENNFDKKIGADIITTGKYSLQGTTQGRYLTGGVPPVRFSM